MEWQFEAFGRSVPSYQDLFTNIIIVQYFQCDLDFNCKDDKVDNSIDTNLSALASLDQ